jgi:2-polyprenyl-3-methyl-5-hydroxy-6-metoxy-1,4-benzoquinol methylase
VDRKWVITTLRRCQQCRLLFRTPTTTAAENHRIYQTLYKEGFTTTLPEDAALDAMLATNFKGSEKDYTHYVEVLSALGGVPGQHLYDFGCSWGYGSHQLRMAGYKVVAYELSVRHATFARHKLGIPLLPPDDAADGRYDVFFSAHVIEHVPSVAEMIALAWRLLKPGGLFLTFAPNGGDEYRRSHYGAWHQTWGFVHPQLLDSEYVCHQFSGYRYAIGTTPLPLEQLRDFPVRSPLVLSQGGAELMFAVQQPAG